ncbi:hypothetical protein N7462_010269 [Penicillium macrosclerotiorum]|uniref:uncharacterized protein n=1 Tax=Penicillium macrosclerotiorum TaxID=303699 RepID=UPI002547E788|nr:uncharacterized protein N7462_010269 [Penicillium macrosclerotiorum]KAJ5669199.1 hypothetical protein N7462_010269 [Penicillium macrosclerotiorum]
MPESVNTTATEKRSQPWQAMQEVQNLFKPEMPAARDANADPAADTESDKTEDEPLKLNLLRAQFNSARSNIANVEEQH